MSAFKALNLESDSESDDEVDNTKEIQIEEALKLYQSALKYHSEGPQSFSKAKEAYTALFSSDIFKYPESLSEYKRAELYGDAVEFDYAGSDDLTAGPVQHPADSAPNTLPQILHLAHKNYGQLMLDILLHRRKEIIQSFSELDGDAGSQALALEIVKEAATPLEHFSEALDKDDADVELWSRAASVAKLVSSQRLARFCLEAVLDGDEDSLDSILQIPGLQASHALQQLRELVQTLGDDLSLNQPTLSKYKRNVISKALRKRLERAEFDDLASVTAKSREQKAVENRTGKQPQRHSLHPAKTDWASIGDSLLTHFLAEQNGMIDLGPGLGIEIFIDADESSQLHSTDVATTTPAPLASIQRPTLNSAIQENAMILDSPQQTSPSKENGTVEDGAGEGNDSKQSDQPAEVQENQPSRKRSTDSAGLPESAEGGRARSKRLRARESIAEGAPEVDAAQAKMAKEMVNQLWNAEQADHYLFTIANELCSRLGVTNIGSSAALRSLFPNSSGAPPKEPDDESFKTVLDMFNALQGCTTKTSAMLFTGDSIDQLSGMSREAGFNAFLGPAKSALANTPSKPVPDPGDCLAHWVTGVNSEWMTIREVALSWIECLLKPGAFPHLHPSSREDRSSYMAHHWPDDLKRNVVQIIVNLDEHIYKTVLDELSQLNAAILEHVSQKKAYVCSTEDKALIEFAQTLYELHFDVYSLIRHPTSGVDETTQIIQKDRLERWAMLARDGINMRQNGDGDCGLDELSLRHIWASTFHLGVCDEVTQPHVIYCIEDVREVFKSLGDDVTILIPNNAVMPELSVAAADRELASINMRDFFKKVFAEEDQDPVTTIENLEPILEPHSSARVADTNGTGTTNGTNGVNGSEQSGTGSENGSDLPSKPSPLVEVRKFLETASTMLRLSLWQRLREAYEAIDYPPKVVSCYLRSIELIMKSFRRPQYLESSEEQRQLTLLGGLRLIDEILSKILAITKSSPQPFDCIDDEHLKSSMGSISELLKVVTATNIYEDLLQVNQVRPPPLQGRPPANFTTVLGKLHDLYIRAWTVQYLLLREAIDQNPDLFESPKDDRFEFLRHVHYATGTRHYCHAANRWFLRLLKDEMLQLKDVNDTTAYDTEMAQVLYDLYGFKCFTDPSDCMEYHSPSETLERKTAPLLLDFLMSQAEKMSMKEIPKTELKGAIEKVHGALGRPKANEDMAQNRKVLNAHLKSPILGLELFRCLDGVGSLATKYIAPNRAIAASKGWYFLMGNIALAKFRSQKRVAAGPTEDLNFAMAFFMQDLEYSIEKWETWYRLAQTYDTQIEELVSWSAEKINTPSFELQQYQRAAIHAYAMAVACATRQTSFDEETTEMVSELYSDFGMRMYASSREPFSMAAFQPKDTEQRFFSQATVFQAPSYHTVPPFTVWKFASVLFKRAIEGNPERWMNHYMLGKCLWKMHTTQEVPHAKAQVPTAQEVIRPFARAIEILPDKKDRREPTLEPHYKLVSIVHKLVLRHELEVSAACEALQATSYSKSVKPAADIDEWEGYVLNLLKALRSADKSGWHHRMTARAAHVIYDEAPDNLVAAMGAKHELTQQIFTKTMAIQVWKPENERPGRHFVYTTQYTRFFLNLLIQLNDRASLEALAKRVRKKPHEFYQHTKLWQEICVAYLRMLRRAGQVPEGHEDAIFKSLNHDEFVLKATRLESWAHQPDNNSGLLDILREVTELKRLNNNLIKPILIDDLIGDTFALLYEQVVPTLPPLPSENTSEGQASAALQPAAAAQPERANMMSLNHLMNLDGASDNASTPPTQAQGPAPVPTTEQPTAKPRTKNVGRREIQKRAEAVVNRPLAAIAPSQSNATPSGNQTVQVVIPVRSADRAAHGQNGLAADGEGDGNLSVAKPEVAESSVPGSVHDSADDESELSEPEEDEEEALGHEEEREHEEDQDEDVGTGNNAGAAESNVATPDVGDAMDTAGERESGK